MFFIALAQNGLYLRPIPSSLESERKFKKKPRHEHQSRSASPWNAWSMCVCLCDARFRVTRDKALCPNVCLVQYGRSKEAVSQTSLSLLPSTHTHETQNAFPPSSLCLSLFLPNVRARRRHNLRETTRDEYIEDMNIEQKQIVLKVHEGVARIGTNWSWTTKTTTLPPQCSLTREYLVDGSCCCGRVVDGCCCWFKEVVCL